MEATDATAKLDAIKSNVLNIMNLGKESIGDAEKIALDFLGEASKKVSKITKDTRIFVRENPGAAVAVVLAAGFVLAKIVRKQKYSPPLDEKIH